MWVIAAPLCNPLPWEGQAPSLQQQHLMHTAWHHLRTCKLLTATLHLLLPGPPTCLSKQRNSVAMFQYVLVVAVAGPELLLACGTAAHTKTQFSFNCVSFTLHALAAFSAQ